MGGGINMRLAHRRLAQTERGLTQKRKKDYV